MIETPRITNDLAEAAQTWADKQTGWEVVGCFFFPDDANRQPKFIKLSNHHEDPQHRFRLNFDDLEYAIGEAYAGPLPGEISIFHTHPSRTGDPSRSDVQAVEDFNKNIDGHPLWRATERHMIYSQWDNSWWWYDLITFGRVGWKWPAEAHTMRGTA